MTVATQQDAPTTATELRSGNRIEPGAGGALVDRLVIPTAGTGTAPITDPDGTTEPAETTSTSTDDRLDLVEIHADAANDDAENLNGEYVTLEHTGASSLDLSGWTLADAAGHSYTIPEGTVLEPGDQLTIYTGSGTDSSTELYWGQSSPTWNNGGDTVILRDATGTTIIEEAYYR